jgi:hypothetical protein
MSYSHWICNDVEKARIGFVTLSLRRNADGVRRLLLNIGRVLDPFEASAGRRAHAFPLLLAAFITKRKTLPEKEFIVLACYDEPASNWWR